MSGEEFMLVNEVAEMLRTPVATLYMWNHKRTGPPTYKVGRKLLYRKSEVIAWVETQR